MSRHLSPTELARETGLERREVISRCMEYGVPIFQGRIDKDLFARAMAQSARHFALFDSAGNLIDSFDSLDEAINAQEHIVAADPDNCEHVRLIAFDANGEPVTTGRSRASVAD